MFIRKRPIFRIATKKRKVVVVTKHFNELCGLKVIKKIMTRE